MVRVADAELALHHLDAAPAAGALHILWGHGWGQSHAAFAALATAARGFAASTLVDFPGFGQSPPPPRPWGTADYADCMGEYLRGLPRQRRIWVGHSFGCRVGLQLAARHPESVDGLFLIAAAGLPRHRSPLQRAQRWLRARMFRLATVVTPEGPARERLRLRFGSADYRNAGPLRPTLVRVVSENLQSILPGINIPVRLLYGADDGETPPEIGERMAAALPRARLTVLPAEDHYSVLTTGRHQVLHGLSAFAEELS